jgi:LPLT family lysophospholipid transporter-like MFS transporter
MTHNADDIVELTLFLALGIIAGAALAPSLIPLDHIRRTCFPAFCMGLLIIALSFTDTVWPARSVLFFMGAAGGMMIVPINVLVSRYWYL